MRRVSHPLILASGPALYRFAVQLHCHRPLEQFYRDDKTALLLLASEDNAHHPGQGAVQHPHLFAFLQIPPGVIMPSAGYNGPDGFYLFRRYRSRGAIPQKAHHSIDFDNLVEHRRIEMGVDKETLWNKGRCSRTLRPPSNSGDALLRENDLQAFTLKRQVHSAFGAAVGLQDIPRYGLIPWAISSNSWANPPAKLVKTRSRHSRHNPECHIYSA